MQRKKQKNIAFCQLDFTMLPENLLLSTDSRLIFEHPKIEKRLFQQDLRNINCHINI